MCASATRRASSWISALALGPVLARAFARLALILRSLVKPHFFLWLASSRSLQTHRPGSLARSVAVFRREPPDADRSRAGYHCGGFRQSWLGVRSARYGRVARRVHRP